MSQWAIFNLLLLLKLSILIFNPYLQLPGKMSRQSFTMVSYRSFLSYLGVLATRIPVTKYLFFLLLIHEFWPQVPKALSSPVREALWRELMHPKVSSQQCSATMTSPLQWGHLCGRVRPPGAGHPQDRSRIMNYPLENSRGILRAWIFTISPGKHPKFCQ